MLALSTRGTIIAISLFFIFVLVLSSALASTPRASSWAPPDGPESWNVASSNLGEVIRAVASLLVPSGSFAFLNTPRRLGTLLLLPSLILNWFSTEGEFIDGSRFPHPLANNCPFPLPNLLSHRPVEPGAVPPELQQGIASLDAYLSNLVLSPKPGRIDSIAAAVVTPAGAIFERGYGVLRANDTQGKQYRVDKHSIYRIASITKVFTVLETFLLQERGAISSWDDPVEKYVPEFKPPSASYGWSEHLRGREGIGGGHGGAKKKKSGITLRQLASHTAGLGRDYPQNDIGKWPGNGTIPPISAERNTTFKNVIRDIEKNPLLSVPGSYPIYSNVGFDLLGLANVAANLKDEHGKSHNATPKTHRELVKRDIFDALGLNSSFYRLPDDKDLKAHIAVPSTNSEWTNVVLGDVDDSAGGQYSSLSDLAKIMQIFLSPNPPSKYDFLPALVRKWLKPEYVWPDGIQAVGAPWEIDYLARDFSYPPTRWPPLTRLARMPVYSKSGNLPGYHSIFSLNPEFGYGVVLLVTGSYANTHEMLLQAVGRVQRPFLSVLRQRVVDEYAGTWVPVPVEDENFSTDGSTRAQVTVAGGQLYMSELVVEGVDVLRAVQDASIESHDPARRRRRARYRGSYTEAVALWSTGRLHEFRLAFGRASLNHEAGSGCMPYWVSIDSGFLSRGASIDLVYWEDGELVYPSAGVRFKRVKVPW